MLGIRPTIARFKASALLGPNAEKPPPQRRGRIAKTRENHSFGTAGDHSLERNINNTMAAGARASYNPNNFLNQPVFAFLFWATAAYFDFQLSSKEDELLR